MLESHIRICPALHSFVVGLKFKKPWSYNQLLGCVDIMFPHNAHFNQKSKISIGWLFSTVCVSWENTSILKNKQQQQKCFLLFYFFFPQLLSITQCFTSCGCMGRPNVKGNTSESVASCTWDLWPWTVLFLFVDVV